MTKQHRCEGTSSGFKLPYLQIQTCLRDSVDFLLPLQFWLSRNCSALSIFSALSRPLHSGLAIFVNICFTVFSLHNWDEYDSPRSLAKIGAKNYITDGFSLCRWGKIEDYYLLKCPFSFNSLVWIIWWFWLHPNGLNMCVMLWILWTGDSLGRTSVKLENLTFSPMINVAVFRSRVSGQQESRFPPVFGRDSLEAHVLARL